MAYQNDIKTRVMRRVYGIWFIRRVLPMWVGVGFFGAAAYRLTAENFFVAKVIGNFLTVTASNMWAAPRFIGVAMSNAEPAVLFMISFSILAIFVMSVKLLRSIRTIVQSGYRETSLSPRKF